MVHRGKAGQVYDRFVSEASDCGNVKEAPMTRDEFESRSRCDVANSPNLASILRNSLGGPILFILVCLVTMTFMDEITLRTYRFLYLDYMGGGYNTDPLPGTLTAHCLGIAGIGLTALLWWKSECVKWIPAIACLIVGIGSTLCAPVRAFTDGYPTPYENIEGFPLVLSGILMISFAYKTFSYLIQVASLDLFSDKTRGIGMLAIAMVQKWSNCLFSIVADKYGMYNGMAIAAAVLVLVTAGLCAVVFGYSKWFQNSLRVNGEEVFPPKQNEVCIESGKGHVINDVLIE